MAVAFRRHTLLTIASMPSSQHPAPCALDPAARPGATWHLPASSARFPSASLTEPWLASLNVGGNKPARKKLKSGPIELGHGVVSQVVV